MPSPTDSLAVATLYLFNLIDAQKVTLGLADNFYGDQQKIPRTPTTCVFASQKYREIQGAPRRVQNTLEMYVHLYISKVTDSDLDWKQADTLAEAVEGVIHADPTFGGLGYHSLVTSNEAGYLRRPMNSMFKGNRLMVQLMSKTQLPMIAGYNQ